MEMKNIGKKEEKKKKKNDTQIYAKNVNVRNFC